jgi:uncharacterized SAM-binding protein YcdF (DUF218 family)
MFNTKIFIFIAAAISFLATIRGAFISGVLNNTTIFLVGITIALFLYGYFFNTLKKKKWLTVTICAVIFTVVIFSVSLAVYGRRVTTTFNEDVVIVLGAGIRDGRILGTLARRLDAAVSYHLQNPHALIIVSGGLGHRETVTDAEIMAQYLIERGVLPSVVILEEMAYSTYTNMRYSQKIINSRFENEPRAVIITSNFHMYRSVRFARQMNLNANVYPSSVPWYSIPFAYVREVASVVKMWVIGR